MKKILTLIGLFGIVITLLGIALYSPKITQFHSSNPKIASLGKVPLHFEPNQGQADSHAKALTRGKGYGMYFESNAVTLSLSQSEAKKTSVFSIHFVGANKNPKLSFEEPLAGKSNYFVGNNPEKWRTDVSHYAKVKYSNMYPGIDLVFYGTEGQLEYDYIVKPGADLKRIQMEIEGSQEIKLNNEGDLVLTVNGEGWIQKAPRIYQEIGNKKEWIDGGYVLKKNNRVEFMVASFDQTRPLVIDPVLQLQYSTYLGGSDREGAGDMAVDQNGNVYLTGITSSGNFPIRNSYENLLQGYDVFVTKLDVTGNMIYSTYLGGDTQDAGRGIAIDANGNAYITGFTWSQTTFPLLNAFRTSIQPRTSNSITSDAFVTKLNAAGNGLVYSTYLGGNDNDEGWGIAVDGNGNAYVTGFTLSTADLSTPNAYQPSLNPPSTPFAIDAFVAKLNPNGNGLVYSTYLGGNGAEHGNGIAVDAAGNAYIAGRTTSTNAFPLMQSYQANLRGNEDAFVTKLNAAGNGLVYSTYLGGDGQDQGDGLSIDNNGNAYITGRTTPPSNNPNNFPVLNAYEPNPQGDTDAFVTKLNVNGNGLIYSTYLGGEAADWGTDIALDGWGNAYVTGATISAGFPVLNAYQTTRQGIFDAFVTAFHARGDSLIYSTYLGGGNGGGNENRSTFWDGGSVAVDSNGRNAYVFGDTNSNDFPIINAYQSNFGGLEDTFVAKIIGCRTPQPFDPNNCQSYVCILDQWVLQNKPIGTSCSDGNTCTTEDACNANGICTGTSAAAGTSCADFDLCDGTETCNGSGACSNGIPRNVDDGNPCTLDSCDPQTGLIAHAPRTIGFACNDNTACTSNDRCEQGFTQTTRICRGTPLAGINDNNPCTADNCNASTGIITHTAQTGTSCTDGRFCNGAETCQAGVCRSGTAPTPNQCQNPDCSEALKGFSPKSNGTLCDDRNMCTSCDGNKMEVGTDCCQSGSCRGAWREGCVAP